LDILLSQQILDVMKYVVDGNFSFQHDGALMLTAFNSVQLLQWKTPIWAMLQNSNDKI